MGGLRRSEQARGREREIKKKDDWREEARPKEPGRYGQPKHLVRGMSVGGWSKSIAAARASARSVIACSARLKCRFSFS